LGEREEGSLSQAEESNIPSLNSDFSLLFTAPTSCNYLETYTNAFPTIPISLVHLLFCDQSLSPAAAAHQCLWRKKIAGSCQKQFYDDLHKAFVQHLQQASHESVSVQERKTSYTHLQNLEILKDQVAMEHILLCGLQI
jgi:hypothetical protein